MFNVGNVARNPSRTACIGGDAGSRTQKVALQEQHSARTTPPLVGQCLAGTDHHDRILLSNNKKPLSFLKGPGLPTDVRGSYLELALTHAFQPLSIGHVPRVAIECWRKEEYLSMTEAVSRRESHTQGLI